MSRATNFDGLEIELHRFAGARVLRVVHPGEQRIEEHRHDWAYIGLYTAGRYRERYDGGEADMSGPCAVLHPAGRPHADVVEAEGLETLTIEFDPAWLRLHGIDPAVHHYDMPDADAGEQILTHIADVGADLLVMGAYGHSRLQELVMGGVTRLVLAQMTAPVLMSR